MAGTLTCHLHWVGPPSKHKWRKSGGRARNEADFPSLISLTTWFQNAKFWNLFWGLFLKCFQFERFFSLVTWLIFGILTYRFFTGLWFVPSSLYEAYKEQGTVLPSWLCLFYMKKENNRNCSWILTSVFSPLCLSYIFPLTEKTRKVCWFLSLAAHVLSVWLLLCNTYALQTWVLQITGKHFNKTDATIREVQDMSHLIPCPHTSVPLFLLSVILGLLAALPMQEWFPASGSDWLQCGQRLRWAQPLAPLGQCSYKFVGGELGLSPLEQSSLWAGDTPQKNSCSALQRLLPLQSHLWHSDLGSGGPGLQAALQLSH